MASDGQSEKAGVATGFLQEIEDEEVKFASTNYNRLHTHLLQLVEEVKLRRLTDIENGEKIEKLTREKNDLERQIDCEHQAKFNLTDGSDQKMEDMKENYQEKIYSLRDQLRKLQYRKEFSEKESQSLKDEVRRLQWGKYLAEKKLKEQDLKLTAVNSAAEHQQGEINRVDKKIATAKKHYDTLFCAQQRLEKNVNEAIKLNSGLMYINQHHTCLISEHKKDNSKLRQQIVDLNVQLNHKPIKPVPVVQLEERLGDLERTVSQEKTLNEKMKKELESNQEKFEEVKKLLQESERQVIEQLAHANKHQSEAREQRDRYEAANTELVKCRTDLQVLQQALDDEKSQHEASLIQWSKQEKDLTSEVNRLKEELIVKESAIMKLEESNSEWAKKNSCLQKEFKDLQGHMSVEKLHKGVQKGLSYLHLRTGATQTTMSVTSQSTQIDPPETRTIPSQCIIPALTNTGTQTQPIDMFDTTVQQLIKSSDTPNLSLQPIITSDTSTMSLQPIKTSDIPTLSLQPIKTSDTSIFSLQPIITSDTQILSSQPIKASVKTSNQATQTDMQLIRGSPTSCPMTTVGTQCNLFSSQQDKVQTNHPNSTNNTQCLKTDSTNQKTGDKMIDRSAIGLTPPTSLSSYQTTGDTIDRTPPTRRSFQLSPVKTNLFPAQSQQVVHRHPVTSLCSPDLSRQGNSKRQSLPCASSVTGNSFDSQAKYRRLSKTEAQDGERSMRMMSPFPRMGVKVVSARKESLLGESRSVAVVTPCKSILKGSSTFTLSASTNKTKSVKFQESHEEREFFSPSPETPPSSVPLSDPHQEYRSVVIHPNQAKASESINREHAMMEEQREMSEIQEHIRQVHKSMETNFRDEDEDDTEF